jgi:hypothetical protein
MYVVEANQVLKEAYDKCRQNPQRAPEEILTLEEWRQCQEAANTILGRNLPDYMESWARMFLGG